MSTHVLCPHCWTRNSAHEIRWIATHPEAIGDAKLGPDAQVRFQPSRFDTVGNALDPKGGICHDLACSHCHLSIPWQLLESPPLLFSILGAPGSGKSYFLAAMVWQLRQLLSRRFSLDFTDADPVNNRVLGEYEETLFLNSSPDILTALPKTEMAGELYQSAEIEGRVSWFPKPFVFGLQPQPGHPQNQRQHVSRALCLYDNAGEHFLPGVQGTGRDVTKHLALSSALFFLFDPTQDARFRKRCLEHTNDPQMNRDGVGHRQEQILHEAASRVRAIQGMQPGAKDSRPLIVVVTKYDSWRMLFGDKDLRTDSILVGTSSGMVGLDIDKVQAISDATRTMLDRLTPEVVSAAEAFSDNTIYIPVSALGRNPVVAEGGMLGKQVGALRRVHKQLTQLSHQVNHFVLNFL